MSSENIRAHSLPNTIFYGYFISSNLQALGFQGRTHCILGSISNSTSLILVVFARCKRNLLSTRLVSHQLRTGSVLPNRCSLMPFAALVRYRTDLDDLVEMTDCSVAIITL
jgi:hypothetical protein